MVSAAEDMANVASTRDSAVKLEVRDVAIRYGSDTAIAGINLDVRENEIFGIIGPANAGKTSFLKALNRMNDFNTNMSVDGDIRFEGTNIRDVRNVYALRSRIGVVFPLPVGLPLTVYENVAFVPRLRGIGDKAELDVIVERCLTRAALWDEVKDRLDSLGSLLSGGQQQRLTIARALSQEPELLMLDEFSIAVDPVTTMRIEDVLKELEIRNEHYPGHQPGAAGTSPCRSHRVLPRRGMRRDRRYRSAVYRPGERFAHHRLY